MKIFNTPLKSKMDNIELLKELIELSMVNPKDVEDIVDYFYFINKLDSDCLLTLQQANDLENYLQDIYRRIEKYV